MVTSFNAFRMMRTALALGALSALGCADAIGPAAERQNIRGIITEVEVEGIGQQYAAARLLIEEDPAVPLALWLEQPSKGYEKVHWYIAPGLTEVFRQESPDDSLIPVDWRELSVGSTVRALSTGAYVDTGLPQAVAEKIILLQAAP